MAFSPHSKPSTTQISLRYCRYSNTLVYDTHSSAPRRAASRWLSTAGANVCAAVGIASTLPPFDALSSAASPRDSSTTRMTPRIELAPTLRTFSKHSAATLGRRRSNGRSDPSRCRNTTA